MAMTATSDTELVESTEGRREREYNVFGRLWVDVSLLDQERGDAGGRGIRIGGGMEA